MKTKIEKAIIILLGLLLLTISFWILIQGYKTGGIVSLGDPYWQGKFQAFDRAPQIAGLTIAAIILIIIELAIIISNKKNGEYWDFNSDSHLNIFRLTIIILASLIGGVFIFQKLNPDKNIIPVTLISGVIILTVIFISIIIFKLKNIDDPDH